MMEIIKDRKESINSLVLWVQHNGNTVERPAHIEHVFNVRRRIFKKKKEKVNSGLTRKTHLRISQQTGG
jgi:hypothetical protein